MSRSLRLLLVGCGLMGLRHIQGLHEVRRHGLFDVQLAGVVDKLPERAGEAAEAAERLLGERPKAFNELDTALSSLQIDAADICTEPASHNIVAEPLLEAGVSCIVEKPLSMTVRGCRRILDAAGRGGATLAVAENYRRDPANRLAKFVIEGGGLGRWLNALQIVIGGGDAVLLTPWRHRATGGILIDLLCHYTDIFNYYFGSPRRVSAFSTLLRKLRIARTLNGESVRRSEIEAEAEDYLNATLHHEEGGVCNLLANLAASGEGLWRRIVFLENGSLEIPMERTGQSVKISKPLDSDYLSLKPHTLFLGQRPGEPYRVSPQAAAEIYDRDTRTVFPDLLNGYRMDFWEADRKLIALELADFFRCLENGVSPETGGWEGTVAVAIVAAALESSFSGRIVELEDVLELRVEAYQARINQALGLI
ncbi:MAG: Gfo/Idh/MocA family oxidoreductase [Nitrososphaerota archaeon]|nr:Gfo/Idh/MocA family oxidoreductase [Candidatus Calditenuaceae archaeon]MDW8072864.1 Gfo/Idh/MocA family oxidoreductase [Nitrososphaerota archaeon]